jgi:hypothetical protein
VPRRRRAAAGHRDGHYQPPLQGDDRKISEQKDQRSADVKEEELHDTTSTRHERRV